MLYGFLEPGFFSHNLFQLQYLIQFRKFHFHLIHVLTTTLYHPAHVFNISFRDIIIRIVLCIYCRRTGFQRRSFRIASDSTDLVCEIDIAFCRNSPGKLSGCSCSISSAASAPLPEDQLVSPAVSPHTGSSQCSLQLPPWNMPL